MKTAVLLGVGSAVLVVLIISFFTLGKGTMVEEGGTGTTATVVSTVALNQPTKGLSTTITPLELVEDSRCPVDVNCIQMGTVRVLASVGDTNPLTYTFILMKPAVVGAFRITLMAVTPAEKHANVEVNPPSYRFTFSVEAVPPPGTGDGTLSGTLTIGPICPVEKPGQECKPTPEMYAAHLVSIYASDRKTFIKNVKPDAEGNFGTNLPAGVYWVDVVHDAVGAVLGAPAAIKITTGEISTIAIAIDTGIR